MISQRYPSPQLTMVPSSSAWPPIACAWRVSCQKNCSDAVPIRIAVRLQAEVTELA